MYIEIFTTGRKPTVLLRESVREDGRVLKRTIANLSGLPMSRIRNMRLALRGAKLFTVEDFLARLLIEDFPSSGNVDAVLLAMERSGFSALMDDETFRQKRRRRESAEKEEGGFTASSLSPPGRATRALVVSEIIHPDRSGGISDALKNTTLGARVGVKELDEREIGDCLENLMARKRIVEERLLRRHASANERLFLNFFALKIPSAPSHEPPAAVPGGGESAFGGREPLKINCCLLMDSQGRPLSFEIDSSLSESDFVFSTVQDYSEAAEHSFLVLSLDRGSLTDYDLQELKEKRGVHFLLTPEAYKREGLFAERLFTSVPPGRKIPKDLSPPSLFSRENVFVFENQELGRKRFAERENAIVKSIMGFRDIRYDMTDGRVENPEAAVLAAGGVMGRFGTREYFNLSFENGKLSYSLNNKGIVLDESRDGLFAVESTLSVRELSPAGVLEILGRISLLEDEFRNIVRRVAPANPDPESLESALRRALFLAMLAFYVKWHLSFAWRGLFLNSPANTGRAAKGAFSHPSGYFAPRFREILEKERRTPREEADLLRLVLDDLAEMRDARVVFRLDDASEEGALYQRSGEETPLRRTAMKLLENIPSYKAR
ncbi:MAG: hypothetical protein LBR53_00955 [Deltaproteobacteria bacterium]|nr:hypothetical protein [Deltaproteobacteria bacterium]